MFSFSRWKYEIFCFPSLVKGNKCSIYWKILAGFFSANTPRLNSVRSKYKTTLMVSIVDNFCIFQVVCIACGLHCLSVLFCLPDCEVWSNFLTLVKIVTISQSSEICWKLRHFFQIMKFSSICKLWSKSCLFVGIVKSGPNHDIRNCGIWHKL